MNTFESSSFKRAFPLIQYNKDREHTFKDANNFCNNCGKPGHSFSQCKHPITSIGLIVFRIRSASKHIEHSQGDFPCPYKQPSRSYRNRTS